MIFLLFLKLLLRGSQLRTSPLWIVAANLGAVPRDQVMGKLKATQKFDEVYEEDEDEHSETLCGSCGGNYNADEFWIGCDICERWFHGKCVKITPAKAESIKQYKCPSCSIRRGRP